MPSPTLPRLPALTAPSRWTPPSRAICPWSTLCLLQRRDPRAVPHRDVRHMTEEAFVRCVRRNALASAYQQSYSDSLTFHSAADLQAAYDE